MIHLQSHERWGALLFGNRFLAAAAITWIFFVLILVNLLPNGLETPYLGVTVSASPQELLPVLGFSDSGNYLRGAIDLQDLVISPDNRWIFNLWPPGQMLLLAIVIKLGWPPVLTLIIVLTFLWSVIGAIIFLKSARAKTWYALVPCVLILWFTDSPFVGWNQSEGALGTDGVGAAILCLLFIHFSHLWEKVSQNATFNPWISGIVVSVILSFLSHLRIIFLFSTIFSFILVLTVKFAKQSDKSGTSSGVRFRNLGASKVGMAQKTKLFLIIFVTFSISLVPFTLYKSQITGSISWSNSDYQWAHRWMTDEYLIKNNAGFLIAGGANWACEIDQVRCNEIQRSELSYQNPYSGFNAYKYADFRNLAFLSILRNPIGFLENRLTALGKTFMGDAGAPVGSSGNLLRGGIFLLLYFYLVIRGIARLRHLDEFELFVLFMLIGLLAPLVVAHFETRYLIPVQAISLIVFTYQFSNYKHRVKVK
jgi:hypothetical protein